MGNVELEQLDQGNVSMGRLLGPVSHHFHSIIQMVLQLQEGGRGRREQRYNADNLHFILHYW